MSFRKFAILNLIIGFIVLLSHILFTTAITYGASRTDGFRHHVFLGVGEAGHIVSISTLGIVSAGFMIAAGLSLLIDLKQHDKNKAELMKNLIIVTRIRTITCLSIFFSLLLIINYLYIWILAAIYADADTNQEENKVAVEYWESVIAYFIAPLQILLFLLSAFSILLNSILVAKAPELLFPHSSTLSTKSNKIDEA